MESSVLRKRLETTDLVRSGCMQRSTVRLCGARLLLMIPKCLQDSMAERSCLISCRSISFLFLSCISCKAASSFLLSDRCRSMQSLRFYVSRSILCVSKASISSLLRSSIFASSTSYSSIVFSISICCFSVNLCRTSIFSAYSQTSLRSLFSSGLLTLSLSCLYRLSTSFFSWAKASIFFLYYPISVWMLLNNCERSFMMKLAMPLRYCSSSTQVLPPFARRSSRSRMATLCSAAQAACFHCCVSGCVYNCYFNSLFSASRAEMRARRGSRGSQSSLGESSAGSDSSQVRKMLSAVSFLESISCW